MRTDLEREAGRRLYAKRTAIEGTWSQGVQGVGLRCNRSIGLAKTYVQQVAIAAAL
jgi:transposase